jgi:hypothetical protein
LGGGDLATSDNAKNPQNEGKMKEKLENFGRKSTRIARN